MKPFYLLLGGIAVAGGGAIYLATSGGSTAPQARPVASVSGSIAGAHEGHVMGTAAATLEVQEFADFQCPACQRFAILTMPDVVQRYVNTGRIRWRFVHFPLSGHQNSPAAHEAAACAGEQDKFWEFHDQLYYNQNTWATARNPERTIRGYAQQVGLDLRQYDDCLDSDRQMPRLQASVEAAVARGVNSTPTFIIGDRMFSGSLPFDQLKVLLDSAIVLPTS
jgi:protein-disulfide isomerase